MPLGGGSIFGCIDSSDCSPSPSWPRAFAPKAHTSSSSVASTVYGPPHATMLTRLSASGSTSPGFFMSYCATTPHTQGHTQ